MSFVCFILAAELGVSYLFFRSRSRALRGDGRLGHKGW